MKKRTFGERIEEVLTAVSNLAKATANGFTRVDKRFEQMNKRFDRLEYKFDRLESVVLNKHKHRIKVIENKLGIEGC